MEPTLQRHFVCKVDAARGRRGANLVHFFAGGNLEQFARDLLLYAQQNSVGCQNANADTSVADGRHGILHLVQTTFGRESCRPRVVAPGLRH